MKTFKDGYIWEQTLCWMKFACIMHSHRIQAFPPDCQNKVLLITLKQNFKSCEDRGVHDSLSWKRKLNLQFRELKKREKKKERK